MAIDAPIHSNESNLPRVLRTGLPVLLVFWRKDCSPCEQVNPALERLAKSYAGKALVVKINAAEESGLLSRYNVSDLPTLVFVKDGREVATATGAADEAALGAWLNYLTAGGPQPPLPGGPSVPLGDGAPSRAPSPGPQANAQSGATGQASQTHGQPVVLTDSTFDQVIRNSKVPVMVDFWATWCGPCKMVAPVVEQLAREFNGRAVMGKLDVDANPNVSARYGIMSIPTLLIFRNGQIVDRIVGAQPAPVLRQRLAQQVKQTA